MQFLITFLSSHLAMVANKKFTTSNIKCEIIPTPRQISSECGFSLLGDIDDISVLKEFISLNNIKFAKIYLKKGVLYEEC